MSGIFIAQSFIAEPGSLIEPRDFADSGQGQLGGEFLRGLVYLTLMAGAFQRAQHLLVKLDGGF